jgi:glycerol kinase
MTSNSHAVAPHLLGALDQGTTSTRFMVFDRQGEVVACAQREHRQIYPQAGWVEHVPSEILASAVGVIEEVLSTTQIQARDIASIGITNQRETAVVWDRKTGEAIYNAVVWQDTRVADTVTRLASRGGQDRFRATTGLPLSTYFSGLKIAWILDHVPGARARAESGELLFGNIDTYLLWNLTGGPNGGLHATDVTNDARGAERTRGDDADDPLKQRLLRRYEGDRTSRSSHLWAAWRPARRSCWADLLSPG